MSLQTSALLITLRLNSFAPKRKDKRITAEVLRKHAVLDKDLGAWSTTLLPAHATDPIAAINSKIRKFHTAHTLTWDREGTGLLPGVKYFDYAQEMGKLKAEWQSKVDTFVDNYPSYLAEAKITLNGLFNPDLYPAADRVREKFAFRLDPEPIPDTGDFRVSMSQSERAALQAGLEEKLKEATLIAQRDLLNRVAEPITRLVSRLANPNGTVREPLLESLDRVLRDVSAYNVTNDPAIESLKREIQQQLTTYTADQLTHDPILRSSAADKAQAILEKMAAWGQYERRTHHRQAV